MTAALEAPGAAVVVAADVAAWGAMLGLSTAALMRRLMPVAAAYAHAPVSGFAVGAVAEGLSGALYFGANLEFAGEALAFSVHAEQSAVSHAWSHGETGLRALAVSSPPCGHCRQFLHELATAASLELHLPTGTRTLAALLPEPFGPHDLGGRSQLMAQRRHGLVAAAPDGDPVVAAALAAADRSYAPYTGAFAGAALATASGRIYRGAYAENAAFNPSLLAMAAALAHLRLAGETFAGIRAAALVERPGAACQRAASVALLAAAPAPAALVCCAAELP